MKLAVFTLLVIIYLTNSTAPPYGTKDEGQPPQKYAQQAIKKVECYICQKEHLKQVKSDTPEDKQTVQCFKKCSAIFHSNCWNKCVTHQQNYDAPACPACNNTLMLGKISDIEYEERFNTIEDPNAKGVDYMFEDKTTLLDSVTKVRKNDGSEDEETGQNIEQLGQSYSINNGSVLVIPRLGVNVTLEKDFNLTESRTVPAKISEKYGVGKSHSTTQAQIVYKDKHFWTSGKMTIMWGIFVVSLVAFAATAIVWLTEI